MSRLRLYLNMTVSIFRTLKVREHGSAAAGSRVFGKPLT
jgi:hypothetical protein